MTYDSQYQYGNMLAPIIADLNRIPDPRVLGRSKFRIPAVLTLTLLGLVAGRRTWQSFQAYAEEYQEFIRDMVPSFTGVPSEDAFSRVVGAIEPGFLHDILFKRGATFAMFANAAKPGPRPSDAPPRQIILDGKTVTGAVLPGEQASKVHIVNAVSDKRVFLGSMGVEVKSNEIPVYPVLMRQLHDSGSLRKGDLISIDAMGCQIKVAEMAQKLGVHFLLSLKGNQSKLSQEVTTLFREGLATYPNGLLWHSTPRLDSLSLMPYNPHPRDLGADWSKTSSLLEKGHGRLDERECAVIYLEPPRRFRGEPPFKATPDLQAKLGLARSWISKTEESWPWIKCVVMVRRKTTELAERKGKDASADKPGADETRFYVSDVALSPLEMLSHVGKHWNVETAHWYLDMAFFEDDSKVRHDYAPENLSTLRKIASNIVLPQARLHHVSVSRVMEKASFNPAYLRALMQRKPSDVGPLKAWKVSPERGFFEEPCQSS